MGNKPPLKVTPGLMRRLEESVKNDDEAHKLLALIDAEFRSDPVSTACFDARIVERVKLCVLKNKQIEALRGKS